MQQVRYPVGEKYTIRQIAARRDEDNVLVQRTQQWQLMRRAIG